MVGLDCVRATTGDSGARGQARSLLMQLARIFNSVAQLCMELGPNEVLDNGPDLGIQSFARYGQWVLSQAGLCGR